MRKKPSSTEATLRTTLELTNDYLSSSTTGTVPSTQYSSTKSRKSRRKEPKAVTIREIDVHWPDEHCEISYVDIDSLKDEKKRKSLGMWLNGQTRPLIPHMP